MEPEYPFDIFDVLRYIKNTDIKSFEDLIQKHNIDINYNFYNQYMDSDDFEFIIPEDDSERYELCKDFIEPPIFNYTFLETAIIYKNYKFCKYLLSKHTIPDYRLSILQLAIWVKNFKIFKLIENVYKQQIDKKQILQYACEYNNFQVFQYMVEQVHMKPEKIDIWRHTVYGDSIDIAKYLLNKGFFPTPRKLKFMLNSACDDGYDALFKWMVINLCKNEKDYINALYAAFVRHYHYRNPMWLFKYCKKHGVNINARLKGFDPLLFQVIGNYYGRDKIDAVKYLLDNGINLNAIDTVGRNICEYVLQHYIDDFISRNGPFKSNDIKDIYLEFMNRGYYSKYKVRSVNNIPKDPVYDIEGNMINNPFENCNVIEE